MKTALLLQLLLAPFRIWVTAVNPRIPLFGFTQNLFDELEKEQFSKITRSKYQFSERTSKNAAPPVPASYFYQYLDHYNKGPSQRWAQRYYSNFAYVSSKTNFKYVFLLIQGEGPLHHKMIYDESQPIVGWAKQFGAALFALEHRFYGESQPTPDQSVKNLKYLNSRQALGDIAEFIIGINKGYGLRDPVWITFGGSYAGSLSLWARQEYPNLIAAAVGSSAPLEATLDFWALQEFAETRFRSKSEGCATNFETAFKEMSYMMKSLDGRSQLAKLLSTNITSENKAIMEKEVQHFFSLLSDRLLHALSYDPLININGSLLSLVEILCNHMEDRGQLPLENLANAIDFLKKQLGHKPTFNYNEEMDELRKKGDQRPWVWQMCTEFGYFQTTNGVRRATFGSSIPLSLPISICTDLFGPEFNMDFISAAVRSTNIRYGGAEGYKGTNVVITNGSNDPWSRLGKHTSNDASVVVHLIKGATHCADLRGARGSGQDIPNVGSIGEAHRIIENNLRIWLTATHSTRVANNLKRRWERPQVRNVYPKNVPIAGRPLLSQMIYPDWRRFKRMHLGRPPLGFVKPPNALADQPHVQQSFITQPVDHFNNDDIRIFRQKYYKNSQWARSGGPIFLVIGGEAPLSSAWVGGLRMFHMVLARKLGATVFALEHRYYGDSIVGGWAHAPNPDLKYLSSLQMLHDVAHFIRTMNVEMHNSSPWITFGGAYGGSLSVWMRELFPDLVIGAVASSPILEAKLDFYEYMRTIGRSLNGIQISGKSCGSILSESFQQMSESIFSPVERFRLSTMLSFNPAWKAEPNVTYVSDMDVEHAFYTVYSTVQAVAFRENFGYRLCSTLSSSNTPLMRLKNIIQMVLKQYQKGDYQYTDVDRYPFIDFLRKAYKYGPDAEAMRLWTWQVCTEFGLFPTTDSADEIFVHALPLSYFMNLCTNVFQEEFFAARVQAGVDKTNLMYGGRDNYKGSNVVVTSGLNDPWQPLSKLTTKDRSIVTVTIRGGYHCADMYTDVDINVREAHAVVEANVRRLSTRF